MTFPDLNRGALAPVPDECLCRDLVVTGDIPHGLNGTLVRNGPNPFSGRFEGQGVLAWWPEAAMLHAVTFAEGRALSYANRWVRTARWADHAGVPPTPQHPDSNPNVNVITHAGAVLALAEGGPPVAIDTALATRGAWPAQTGFAAGMTAHPKRDPVTGELVAFRAHWESPWLRYGVLDAGGRQVVHQEIDLPEPAMIHDMAVTDTHSILLDLGVGYDFSLLDRGYRIPVCWREQKVSRLAVLPRHGGEVTWLEIAPCFIQHVVNAFNADDGTIVLDAVRYPQYFRIDPQGRGFLPDPLGVLWRYRIDWRRGRVSEHQLADDNIELPRINESRTGRYHRYAYAVEQPTAAEMRGIVRYDGETQAIQRHHVDPGDQNSEPVFVPDDRGSAEDDGWVLVSVYRRATDSNEIRILDARDLGAGPLATVSLGRRIPAGFHGAWIPAA